MAQYIGFQLDGEEYSVPILNVREIINRPGMVRMPQAPEYLAGVSNLRGSVIPIVSTRKLVKRAGGNGKGNGEGDKVIVLVNGRTTFGILVDRITGVMWIEDTAIEPPGRILNGAGEQFVGVAKHDGRLVVVLDTVKLLPAGEAGPFEDNVVGVQETDKAGKVEVVRKVQTMGGEVEVRELRDAREFLSRKIGANDPNQKILEPILAFMEAMAGKQYEEADAVVERLVRTTSDGLFQEVGKVTRRLHDSLKSFKEAIDPKLSSLATSEVPSAIDRLRFVIDRTEEAANKTMGIVEKHLLGMDELAAQIRKLQGPEDTLKYLKGFKNALEDDLTEIITTQSFQDITGQTIKKVIHLVEEIEKELVGMVATFGVKVDAGAKGGAEPRETVSQADVDDLLKEFGF